MTSVLHPANVEQSHFLVHRLATYNDSACDMSSYGQHYPDYVKSVEHSYDVSRELPATSTYAQAPILPSSHELPSHQPIAHSYSLPSYGAPLPSLSYPVNSIYRHDSAPYTMAPYQPAISNPTHSYSYYENTMPAYNSLPAGQLPFPSYDTPLQHLTPQHSPRLGDSVDMSSVGSKLARSTSILSTASSLPYQSSSRATSPSVAELSSYGRQLENGMWVCAHVGCSSKSKFKRGCDLRKHYRRHTKTLFCRHPECADKTTLGFSSKKDRDRHEQKHNPNICCEVDGCLRKFSRMDNMKDHVKRIHRKEQNKIRIGEHA